MSIISININLGFSAKLKFVGRKFFADVYELRSRINPKTTFNTNAYTITSIYYGSAGVFNIYIIYFTSLINPKIFIEYRIT